MKSSRFILWQLYCLNHKDRGAALAIAIALGLIAALVGIIMLTRSFRDQTDVAALQSATGSESLGESGVTRSLDLINTYRAIASVNACGSDWKSDKCTDTTNASWATVGNSTPTGNYRLDNLINDLKKPAKTLPNNTTVTSADIPSCNASLVNTTPITNFTNQLWRNSSSSAAEGQFRLINYLYDPGDKDKEDDGVGILTVEGRIRQAGSGSTATETAGTGTTRLEVAFPVELQLPWGLWIRGDTPFPGMSVNRDLKVPDEVPDTVDAEIRDSGCADGTLAKTRADEINLLLSKGVKSKGVKYISTPSKGVKYISTPGKYNDGLFPDLPSTTGAIKKLGLTISSGEEIFNEGTYIIYQNTTTLESLVIKSGKLVVDAPKKKVKIILEGALKVGDSSGSKAARIEVTEGTTLELYAADIIEIYENGNLINHAKNTPDNFQIYTLADSESSLGSTRFKVSGILKNVFIFAPYQILLQDGSSQITGTLWSRSWQVLGKDKDPGDKDKEDDGKDPGDKDKEDDGVGIPAKKFIQGKPPAFCNLAIARKIAEKMKMKILDPDICSLKPKDRISLEDSALGLNNIGKVSSWRNCTAQTKTKSDGTIDYCPQ